MQKEKEDHGGPSLDLRSRLRVSVATVSLPYGPISVPWVLASEADTPASGAPSSAPRNSHTGALRAHRHCCSSPSRSIQRPRPLGCSFCPTGSSPGSPSMYLSDSGVARREVVGQGDEVENVPSSRSATMGRRAARAAVGAMSPQIESQPLDSMTLPPSRRHGHLSSGPLPTAALILPQLPLSPPEMHL